MDISMTNYYFSMLEQVEIEHSIFESTIQGEFLENISLNESVNMVSINEGFKEVINKILDGLKRFWQSICKFFGAIKEKIFKKKTKADIKQAVDELDTLMDIVENMSDEDLDKLFSESFVFLTESAKAIPFECDLYSFLAIKSISRAWEANDLDQLVVVSNKDAKEEINASKIINMLLNLPIGPGIVNGAIKILKSSVVQNLLNKDDSNEMNKMLNSTVSDVLKLADENKNLSKQKLIAILSKNNISADENNNTKIVDLPYEAMCSILTSLIESANMYRIDIEDQMREIFGIISNKLSDECKKYTSVVDAYDACVKIFDETEKKHYTEITIDKLKEIRKTYEVINQLIVNLEKSISLQESISAKMEKKINDVISKSKSEEEKKLFLTIYKVLQAEICGNAAKTQSMLRIKLANRILNNYKSTVSAILNKLKSNNQ